MGGYTSDTACFFQSVRLCWCVLFLCMPTVYIQDFPLQCTYRVLECFVDLPCWTSIPTVFRVLCRPTVLDFHTYRVPSAV